MADEETFDIDIYGDGQDGFAVKSEPQDNHMSGQQTPVESQAQDIKPEDWKPGSATPQAADSNNASHGVKRKSSTMDDRPVDPNSTPAVQITELHWWITEDDLRGWCVGAGCEPEIKDLTFNEHKVNGKSKGYVFVFRFAWLTIRRQVYLEFTSQAAASALKNYVDNLETRKSEPKTAIVSYHYGHNNPYKTLPKDNQGRRDTRGGRDYNSNQNFNTNNNFNSGGNFRGRGNYGGNRGGAMNAGYNRGGFQGGMGAMGMGGAPMGMGAPFGGGFNTFNRGGMMGMRGGMQQNRGGRGGMVGPGMMGPMGAMGMGGMPMGAMGMPGGGMMGMNGETPRRCRSVC
jgi:hypothetical protein